jgi:uncharacterized protein (TIGR02588 family)
VSDNIDSGPNQRANREPETEHPTNASQGRTVAEKITLALSAAVVLSILGLVTYLYYQGEEEPANVVATARVDEIRQEREVYYVPVEVKNEGDRTVEDLTVEGELITNGQIETAEFTITYLAAGERATGAFIYTEDPLEGELTVRPVSYMDP